MLLNGCHHETSTYTFENETGQVTNMTPISSYANSSDYEGFVWEKGNLQLTPQNDTIMKVSYSSGSTPEFAYGEGSRFSSVFYSQYGEYEAQIKASNGVGMVTSFITMSDDGDEIDFEILGKSILKITTNYFHKGVLDFTKAEYHDVGVNVSAEFHTYGIKWTPDCIEWWFDSRLLRSVYRNSTDKTEDEKYKYPTSPSRIMFGIWDGAETRQKGTMKWTGRSVWNEEAKKNGYSAYVKSVKIACNGVDKKNLTAIRFMPNSVRAETGMPSKAAPSWLFQTSTDFLGFIVIAILFIVQ
ncbi:hypothetical protein MP638_001332 [Amoeboaphelidium occidentale]|nr:hypothetical protein MP638_001332 [Amoeboaphelidium occidentale]